MMTMTMSDENSRHKDGQVTEIVTPREQAALDRADEDEEARQDGTRYSPAARSRLYRLRQKGLLPPFEPRGSSERRDPFTGRSARTMRRWKLYGEPENWK
jgi:hypothetical protein